MMGRESWVCGEAFLPGADLEPSGKEGQMAREAERRLQLRLQELLAGLAVGTSKHAMTKEGTGEPGRKGWENQGERQKRWRREGSAREVAPRPCIYSGSDVCHQWNVEQAGRPAARLPNRCAHSCACVHLSGRTCQLQMPPKICRLRNLGGWALSGTVSHLPRESSCLDWSRPPQISLPFMEKASLPIIYHLIACCLE